jgi:type IV fimbrial biogenesis protein FimT
MLCYSCDGSCGPRRGLVRGFTLIELMIVLALCGILLGLAMPSLATVLRDARVTDATNEIFGAIFLARSEAIKRGQRVTLCVSANATQCTAGGRWDAGWILFEDANANAQRDAGEPLIRVGGMTVAGVVVSGNDPVRHYISYVPSGMSRRISGALQMGTVTVCAEQRARQIVINATGRPRLVRTTDC